MDPVFFLLVIAMIWFVLLFLATQDWFRVKNPEIGLFYLLFRTEKFSGFIDTISKRGRYLWFIILDSGVIVAIGVLIASSIMFIVNMFKFLTILAIQIGIIPYSGNATENIQTVDVIPAIPFLSISLDALPYFIVAILIAAAFHELFHGVAARVSDIELKSTGLAVFLLFFGAFVEPEEEQIKKTDNRTKMRVAAAGAMANILLSVLIFALFLPPIFSATLSIGYNTEPSGALIMEVVPEEPADLNRIKPNWVIIGINDTQISSYPDFGLYTRRLKPNQTILIHFYQHDSILLETSTHPNNKTRGFIGVSAWNFYKPKASFLPIQLPYIYSTFLIYSLSINIMLALINLLPIPLLDGDMLIGALLDSKVKNSKKYQNVLRWSLGLIFLANFLLTLSIKGWTVI